jgi:hypothetical protein
MLQLLGRKIHNIITVIHRSWAGVRPNRPVCYLSCTILSGKSGFCRLPANPKIFPIFPKRICKNQIIITKFNKRGHKADAVPCDLCCLNNLVFGHNKILDYVSTILLPPSTASTNTFDGYLATISGFGSTTESNLL